MDDIELLKLENKALRFQNETMQKALAQQAGLEAENVDLKQQLHLLRRFRQLVERAAAFVQAA